MNPARIILNPILIPALIAWSLAQIVKVPLEFLLHKTLELGAALPGRWNAQLTFRPGVRGLPGRRAFYGF